MAHLPERAKAGRLLWIEHQAYSARLLGGGRFPWLDATSCVALLRQAQGLLRSDVVTLPVAEIAKAWQANDVNLMQAMTDKTRRAHGPLKELLAHEGLRGHLNAMASALRASTPISIFVLTLPSPRDWAAQTLASVGGTESAVDEDAVDASAACVADFLRQFASTGIDAVLLRESLPWINTDAPLWLELYRPVANVARHYDWDWGLELPAVVKLPQTDAPGFTIAPGFCGIAPAGLMAPAALWQGQALPTPPAGSFDHLTIPDNAHPETVLSQLAVLRERASAW